MTVPVLTITIAVLALAVALFVFRAVPGVRTYFKFRGQRLVKCPETQTSEVIRVDAKEAGLGAFYEEPTVHLDKCSRWPERQTCGQECLKQVEADPENCLVWNIVAKWYEGKKCVFCQKPIAPLGHIDHAPALLGPDFRTTEWNQISPEKLPEIFSTYQPVCWNCHVAETLRRLHPELVTGRPAERKRAM